MITAISSCVGDYLLHVIVRSRNVVLIFTRFHASVSNRTPVSQTGHPLYATPNDIMLCRKCASTPDSGVFRPPPVGVRLFAGCRVGDLTSAKVGSCPPA